MKKSTSIGLGLATTILLLQVFFFIQGKSETSELQNTGNNPIIQEEKQTDTKNESLPSEQNLLSSNQLLIKLTFQRAGMSAANQTAIWIENQEREVVRTINVSRFTAQGGFVNRPDSLNHWVSSAEAANLSNQELDTISSATLSTGNHSIEWDGKDGYGRFLPNGDYTIFLEGTLYWSSNVLYSQNFSIQDQQIRLTGELDTRYSEDNDTNRDMISKVQFSVITN